MNVVDQRTKDIVNGFIKQSQKLLPNEDNSYYNIPPFVSNICLIYYHHPEYFTKCGEFMRLNKERTLLTMKGYYNQCTAYGNHEITGNQCVEYVWIFQIMKVVNAGSICVGIDCSNKQHFNGLNYYIDGIENDYYVYDVACITDGTAACLYWQKSGAEYMESDVETLFAGYLLKMVVNVPNKTIQWFIQAPSKYEDQNEYFSNVLLSEENALKIDFSNDKKYYMTVCLRQNPKLKLINFQKRQITAK